MSRLRLLLVSTAMVMGAGALPAVASATVNLAPAGARPVGQLPAATATADFNSDGSVDFSDYLDFIDLFATAAVAADVNIDGVVDFSDYLDFIAGFTAGC